MKRWTRLDLKKSAVFEYDEIVSGFPISGSKKSRSIRVVYLTGTYLRYAWKVTSFPPNQQVELYNDSDKSLINTKNKNKLK